MSDFNISSYLKDQYLTEAGEPRSKVTSLVPLIVDAIKQVDENLSYKDLAEAIGIILKDSYGTHNINPFMDVLHNSLGINESEEDNYRNYQKIGDRHTLELEKIFKGTYNSPYVSMGPYGNGDLTFRIKDELSDNDWNKALTWVKDQGFEIESESNWYEVDIDDDRAWYPVIKFKFNPKNI